MTKSPRVMPEIRPIKKLLVANRSEIAIRVFRTSHELGIRTVAIYSHEDRFALHRFKADEAYPVGRAGEPLRAYLDIEGILAVARSHEVDAIHPGYGFLSENPDFARACLREGLIFCGPTPEILEKLGDKIVARKIARDAGVNVLSGSDEPLIDAKAAAKLASKLGYPVLLKAARGGGGRGMRVVEKPEQLADSLAMARREANNAFGSPDVFLEKFILRPRHIEVQLLGDKHGNLVHLYERDCSLQRRHQKVVEIAPALRLTDSLRAEILEAALCVGRAVNYENAGTVEFLVDSDTDQFFFIEVNPRIQVEHTVTEQVTGVDLVKCQIMVAQGRGLSDPEIAIPSQDVIQVRGFAMQCRVTTEDPENKFLPDHGRIGHYRSTGGTGVRLDAGTAFSGALVTPYYDSLLVKVTTSARAFADAARRMERCLQEFRVRGVKTNIPFLINLVTHPRFVAGGCTTRFLDETPELFDFVPSKDRATKLFQYLADVIVNGHPLIKDRPKMIRRSAAPLPAFDHDSPPPPGARQRFLELGPEKFCRWILQQKPLLLTDTTMRDAHQSLLATRMRSFDMIRIADALSRTCPQLFSLEMWGGATFDTAMRFLKECPWQRLADLRERVPNILFQMLLRGSNALGYATYPDNVVKEFVKEAHQAGIDLFRVFDSLNWIPNMRIAVETCCKVGALCEGSICYTGDLLDPKRDKYSLTYYVELAQELEKMGCHLLAIKDMAGLCKPYAAEKLIKTLKQEIGIPIHFHTHDTSGVQAAAILKASEAGVDVADAAFAPFSGLTSQPNLNSIVESLRFSPRETGLSMKALQSIAQYWEAVREYYAPFEAEMKASTADVYENEIPGGQYTNLFEQAKAVGLANRWHEICGMYAKVNQLLGDIVKVTPSSKAVGDLAIFLVTNNLTTEDVLREDRDLAFPESVVDLVSGRMGKPTGGFPAKVRERILRGEKPLTARPGTNMPPADLDATGAEIEKLIGQAPPRKQVISYLMFPRVFRELHAHQDLYADTSVLPTPLFLYGPEPGEEYAVEIERGKTLIIKYITSGETQPDGKRTVFFELNGQPRDVVVVDKQAESLVQSHVKADPADPRQVGSPMPGLISSVAVRIGDKVKAGQKLLAIEAMKMETNLQAEQNGVIAELLVQPGTSVLAGDLLLRFAP